MANRDSPAEVAVLDLVKRYPGRDSNAVDGLSFEVEQGEVFGLLGPNGAGKSTTVGILTTMIRASGGIAMVGGIDVVRHPVAARARFAVVPQHNNLDRALTPRQNLTFHAAYHGMGRAERRARAEALLAEFGLTGQADARIDWFSGGMAQRLMIARALIHRPRVLFLDEPTNGLEPQARLMIRAHVRRLRERGVTVVLTSHAMNEVAELADRVAIIDHGRLLTVDTPANLTRRLAGRSVLELTVVPAPGDSPEGLLAALGEVAGVARGERLGPAAAPGAVRGRAGAAGPPGNGRLAAAIAAGLVDRDRLAAAVAAGKVGGGRLAAAAAGGSGGGGRLAAAAAGGGDRLATAALAAQGQRETSEVRLRLHLAAEPAAVLGAALAVLTTRAATLSDVHIDRPGLEEIFIELTGKESR